MNVQDAIDAVFDEHAGVEITFTAMTIMAALKMNPTPSEYDHCIAQVSAHLRQGDKYQIANEVVRRL